MKTHVKPIVALASGAILLSGILCQTTNAQSVLVATGTSILAPELAPIGGFAANPQEYLSVSWFVVENTVSDVYTYAYTLSNPAGDVLLNNNGTPTTTPEIVDGFTLDFNTTLPGAFLLGSQVGGAYTLNNGVAGLSWFFPAINPGSSSTSIMAYNSLLAPLMGNASGSGANGPGPWGSVPGGQPVAVPRPVPEPATTTLLALTLLGLPFRSTLRRFFRQS